MSFGLDKKTVFIKVVPSKITSLVHKDGPGGGGIPCFLFEHFLPYLYECKMFFLTVPLCTQIEAGYYGLQGSW